MRIIEQWKTYVGPKDERIEMEMNRIYKVGFIMFGAGMVVALYYSGMLSQVQFVFDVQTTGSGSATFGLPGAFMYIWMVVVCLVCSILQCRKGFVDTGRFAETDKFPSGYFALLSGLCALAVGLLAFLLRTLATVQVYGYATLWLESVFVAVSLSLALFVVLYGGFYLFYRAAKRCRVAREARFDND